MIGEASNVNRRNVPPEIFGSSKLGVDGRSDKRRLAPLHDPRGFPRVLHQRRLAIAFVRRPVSLLAC
jgi:hypothetical protein